MKIHIVQKGDTLWEIAQKYGVDFDELKQVNSQLSSPDMIMPGMKIKIPSSTKQVKKESMVKETKKPMSQKTESIEGISPKPLSMKEDDHKKPAIEQEEPLPHMPQLPNQQMVQMPVMHHEMKSDADELGAAHQHEYKPKKEKPKMMPEEQMQKQYEQMHHQPMQMVPMCCQYMPPCCQHMHHYHSPMHGMHGMHGGWMPPVNHDSHQMMAHPDLAMNQVPGHPNYSQSQAYQPQYQMKNTGYRHPDEGFDQVPVQPEYATNAMNLSPHFQNNSLHHPYPMPPSYPPFPIDSNDNEN